MSCIERSIAIYHTDAAIAGTVVTVPDPSALGNIWRAVTVINDTDQDIKFSYLTTSGYAGEFIVPKSVKGFTRVLKNAFFDNTTIKVWSMNGGSAASGKITINLGV